MIKLYGSWRSSATHRVRIALNLKQISYSQQTVDLHKDGGEQHKPEYLSLNPQALVPTLVDGNTIVSQSMAILEYLEDKYPAPGLLPEDLKKRALTRQLCNIIVSDLQPLNNMRVLKYLSDDLSITDKSRQDWQHHWLRNAFSAYQSLLIKQGIEGKYSLGEELSLADACLIPQICKAQRTDFSMNEFKPLMAIYENCLELERFKNALPENQPDAE